MTKLFSVMWRLDLNSIFCIMYAVKPNMSIGLRYFNPSNYNFVFPQFFYKSYLKPQWRELKKKCPDMHLSFLSDLALVQIAHLAEEENMEHTDQPSPPIFITHAVRDMQILILFKLYEFPRVHEKNGKVQGFPEVGEMNIFILFTLQELPRISEENFEICSLFSRGQNSMGIFYNRLLFLF